MPFWSGMGQLHWKVIHEITITRLEPSIKLQKTITIEVPLNGINQITITL